MDADDVLDLTYDRLLIKLRTLSNFFKASQSQSRDVKNVTG